MLFDSLDLLERALRLVEGVLRAGCERRVSAPFSLAPSIRRSSYLGVGFELEVRPATKVSREKLEVVQDHWVDLMVSYGAPATVS